MTSKDELTWTQNYDNKLHDFPGRFKITSEKGSDMLSNSISLQCNFL